MMRCLQWVRQISSCDMAIGVSIFYEWRSGSHDIPFIKDCGASKASTRVAPA